MRHPAVRHPGAAPKDPKRRRYTLVQQMRQNMAEAESDLGLMDAAAACFAAQGVSHEVEANFEAAHMTLP